MKQWLKGIYGRLRLFGFDPLVTLSSAKNWASYSKDFKTIKQQSAMSLDTFPFGTHYPCLGENTSDSGVGMGHYFHQDLLVARRIFAARPLRHIDVGSRIDGFVGHVASFRSIEVLDIRPQPSTIPNVTFLQADLMGSIPSTIVDGCDSLSCLHALEHFGLGRYGDPINIDGHLLGLNNLTSIVKPGGTFYLSVPIGQQRIEFNAHRVFSVSYLLSLLSDTFEIKYFSYVDDSGELHEDVVMNEPDVQNNFGCTYGCGIFEMIKK